MQSGKKSSFNEIQIANGNIIYEHLEPVLDVNVPPLERWLSGLVGGVLMFAGFRQRRWLTRVPLLLSGGGLLYRGMRGQSFLYRRLYKAQDTRHSVRHNQGVKVEHVVTISRPVEELYQFWRDFTNLPRFMRHLQAVEVMDDTTSHWVASAPAGNVVEWDAEIIIDRANEMISWRSLPGSEVGNAGSVHFTPRADNKSTEVRVELAYAPPVGQVGRMVAKLFGEEPNIQVREDLRRFKEIVETGEMANVEGQPVGQVSKLRRL